MKIETSDLTISSNKPATIEMSDQGNAFVSLRLMIGDDIRLTFEETYSASYRRDVPLAKGNYACLVGVTAYAGGLGRAYKSEVKINGHVVATANGSIPGSKTYVTKHQAFVLTVT